MLGQEARTRTHTPTSILHAAAVWGRRAGEWLGKEQRGLCLHWQGEQLVSPMEMASSHLLHHDWQGLLVFWCPPQSMQSVSQRASLPPHQMTQKSSKGKWLPLLGRWQESIHWARRGACSTEKLDTKWVVRRLAATPALMKGLGCQGRPCSVISETVIIDNIQHFIPREENYSTNNCCTFPSMLCGYVSTMCSKPFSPSNCIERDS